MKILLATSNKGKVHEMRAVLAGLDHQFMTLDDVPGIDAPTEDGTTYAENALKKARHYYNETGIAAIADDSGIEVEALSHELGIHTRRWGKGANATDQEWIDYFLERMSREQNKRARFLCVIAYIDERGTEHIFEGSCDGVITERLEAEYLPGLPISACFRPDESDVVFSALSTTEKGAISHRGRALHKLRDFLNLQTT